MCLSHKTLWNCIELVGHVKDSVIYLDEETKRKKLLNYLIRFFKVLCKFCEVYFKYKCRYVVNQFNHDSASEIKNVCDFLLDIIKFVKVHVGVLLCKDAKPHDIIRNMCFKAIAKFQNYLVAVNFFNKEMFQKSALNLC